MGLYRRDDLALQCPLTAIRAEGNVTGTCVHLTLTQTYVNADDHPIEAVYIFPLSDEGAVTGLEIRVGDRTIRGKVMESEEAFEEYDDAVSKGDLGVLLEQRRPNIFEISVGNVLPDEPVTVAITTVEELAWRDHAVQLRIPTVVGPRYIPGQPAGERDGFGRERPTDRVPDADHITPPVLGGDSPYRVSLELDVQMPGRIEHVRSATHDIVVDMHGDDAARVELLEEALPDRDIVIDCALEPGLIERVIVDRGEDSDEATLLWSFLPDLPKPEDRPKEVVFVIDHSGSMTGRKMEQARTALRICLRSLSEGDRFNIIQFDDTHHTMHEAPVPLTQAALNKADKWIRRIEAEGGTEMLPPLRDALGQLGAEGYEPILVLLTDGEVGNDQEIVRFAKAEQGRTRLFTFGIDSAVNSWLLRELADNSSGAVEFITPDERVEEKVLRQFTQIKTPVLHDLGMVWKGVKVRSSCPAPPFTVYWGQPLTVLAQIGSAKESASLVLRGRGDTAPFESRHEVDLSQGGVDPAVRLCWAKRHLKSLEAAAAAARGRRERSSRKRLLEFALDYGLASSVTSFVAIEERQSAPNASPETRVIPVMLPHAWETERDMDSLTLNYAPSPMTTQACMAAPMASPIGGVVQHLLAKCEPGPDYAEAEPSELAYAEEEAFEPSDLSGASLDDKLYELASRQGLDGSWANGDVLSTSLALLAFATAGHDLASDLFGPQLVKAKQWLLSGAEPSDTLVREMCEVALRAVDGGDVAVDQLEGQLGSRTLGEDAMLALNVLCDCHGRDSADTSRPC